ncbi:lymphocyte expansion molecule [Plakobranchus ocellatus]|uniref:Lymphocyte expansion molecule n=1 Tax=Plakobranchus ocellatus TaxID=259542 RepID=A0AAV3ZVV2_9GAST|nr:lymphocyte expansion molecule [Plakobranchus ocellatus]
MAEKKFTGAPFGTQTARFDVTGVHPNKKVPGTFTQIPYDKPSTMELSQKCEKQNMTASKILKKMDNHLQNAKRSLTWAKEYIQDMNDKKYKSSFSSTPLIPQESIHRSSIDQLKEHALINVIENTIDMEAGERYLTTYSPNSGLERNVDDEIIQQASFRNDEEIGAFVGKLQKAPAFSTLLKKQGLNREDKRQVKFFLTENERFSNLNKTDNFAMEFNKDKANAGRNGQQSEHKFHMETNEYVSNHSRNNNYIPNKSLDNTNSDSRRAQADENRFDVSNNQGNITEDVFETSTTSEDRAERPNRPILKLQYQQQSPQTSNFTIKKSPSRPISEEKISKHTSRSSCNVYPFLTQNPLQAVSLETSRSNIAAVISLHTGLSSSCLKRTSVISEKIEKSVSDEKKVAFSQPWTKQNIQASPDNSPRERHTSLLDSRKTPELGSDDKASGSFTSSGLTGPLGLKEKFQEDCKTLLRRKLGPGAYNTIVGGFSTKAVENKASGPGWARQLEVERLASLPHLLYKEQWEENKMLKRKLGPGSYDIKDFIQIGNEKPRSGRGICDNLAPRFEKAHLSATPGPGTYGIGGVPQRALEEKDYQSTSTKGMLDKGDRKRTLPSVGSHLGPGTYRHKTCTDELLNKVTSLKGPYKLYSGDRNKPISEGYLAAPQLADLGPGQYEIGSFVDELHNKDRRMHGRFGKMAQYPEVPTDRLFLFSQAHCNRRDVPGPGAYSIQELSKPTAVNSPGFLSSAKRDDKISQKFFTRNFNPVGAGRYDIQKFEEAQDVNGHSSVFKSKSGKPNLEMAKFLQERIRSKDVKVEDRVVLSQPCRITRSITVM